MFFQHTHLLCVELRFQSISLIHIHPLIFFCFFFVVVIQLIKAPAFASFLFSIDVALHPFSSFIPFFVCYPNTHYCSLCSAILTFNTYIYVPQTQNIFILFSPLLPSWFFLPMNDLHMVFLCNSISKQFSYCIQMYKSEFYCIRSRNS